MGGGSARTASCVPVPAPQRSAARGREPHFAALLARADVAHAAFARLTGVTPRHVNNWCRGRATVPVWAALLAALLQDQSPEALMITLEEAAIMLKEAPRALELRMGA